MHHILIIIGLILMWQIPTGTPPSARATGTPDNLPRSAGGAQFASPLVSPLRANRGSAADVNPTPLTTEPNPASLPGAVTPAPTGVPPIAITATLLRVVITQESTLRPVTPGPPLLDSEALTPISAPTAVVAVTDSPIADGLTAAGSIALGGGALLGGIALGLWFLRYR